MNWRICLLVYVYVPSSYINRLKDSRLYTVFNLSIAPSISSFFLFYRLYSFPSCLVFSTFILVIFTFIFLNLPADIHFLTSENISHLSYLIWHVCININFLFHKNIVSLTLLHQCYIYNFIDYHDLLFEHLSNNLSNNDYGHNNSTFVIFIPFIITPAEYQWQKY